MKSLFLILALCLSMTAQAQQLEPSETHAVFGVVVTDFNMQPLEGEQIIFRSKSGEEQVGTSNLDGTFDMRLAEGDVYKILVRGIGGDENYTDLDLPEVNGTYGRGEIRIQIRTDITTYTLDDVHFDTGLSRLRPESYKELDNLADVLAVKSGLVIEVAGHTDNQGSEASNQELSQARAEAVRNYLLRKGIKAERVQARGYGELQPIADNSTDNGRQENRRTEVRILEQ